MRLFDSTEDRVELRVAHMECVVVHLEVVQLSKSRVSVALILTGAK